MKNAKKILLLALSLVMLIGILAFGSTAASTATVQYPDGTKETVTVGEAIVPKSFDASNLYYGQNETVYKDDSTPGWTFSYTVDKTTKTIGEDLIVPEEAAGKTITVGGATKVLFTVTVGETVTGYTTAAELNSYLASMDHFARIKFYSNISIKGPDMMYGKRVMDKNSSGKYVVENTNYHIDINGYTWTLTRTGDAIASRAMGVRIYSSRPGGRIEAPNATTLAYTDNDDYKIIDGVLYGNKADQYINDPASPAKPNGSVYFGELSDPTTTAGTYGKNLTVVCKSIVRKLYGGGVSLFGGTYVQTGTASGFLGLTSKTVNIKNSTFVITNASTVPLSDINTSYKTLTNCTFVYAGDGSIPVTKITSTAVTFSGCTFINVSPSYTASHKYTNAKYGTSFYYPTADLNASETVEAYLAHTSTVETVTANGVTYLLDGKVYASTDGLKTVTWKDGVTEYFSFAEGESFTTEGESFVKATSGYLFDATPYTKTVEGIYSYVPNPVPVVTEVEGGYAVSIDPEEASFPVFFTTKISGKFTYYYDAATAVTDLRKALGDSRVTSTKAPAGSVVKLYQDMTISASMTIQGAGSLYLDFNGNKLFLTVNGDTFAFDTYAGSLYLYSTAKGGELIVPNNHFVTRSNSNAAVYVGETSAPTTAEGTYGKNLTIRCNAFNNDLWGSGMYIWGGTFVQNANSPVNYMFVASQKGSSSYSTLQKIKNATVEMNKANSYILHWRNAANSTLENCTFISNATGVKVVHNPTKSAAATTAPKFVNCGFVNVIPSNALDEKIPTYNNCRFSLDKSFCSHTLTAVINGASVEAIMAYTDLSDSIVYGDISYPVNFAALPATQALAVEWEDGTVDYWALGATPDHEVIGYEDIIEKREGEIYYRIYDPRYVIDGITVVASENLGTSASGYVKYFAEDPLAFSYAVGDEISYVVLDLSIAEEERAAYYGEIFHQELNETAGPSIVMYTDIYLTKGVQFGTISYTIPYEKDENGDIKLDKDGNPIEKKEAWTSSHQFGNVSWDLNGYTVTVSKDVTPLTMTIWTEAQKPKPTYSVLHYLVNKQFKLYSSVPGGEYINESSYPIFGGLKYSPASYILGTDDPTVSGGENFTLTSLGNITLNYEPNDKGVTAYGENNYRLIVNGGTYIYQGTKIAFGIGQFSRFMNATLITTGKAQAVLAPHYYRSATTVVENCTVICSDSTTALLAKANADSTVTSKLNGTHSATVKNCIIVNAIYGNTYPTGDSKITLSGNLISLPEYAVPEEGKELVYTSMLIRGENVKLCAYYDAATLDIVTVYNEVTRESELWIAGSIYVMPDLGAREIVFRNGEYFYVPGGVPAVFAGSEDITAEVTTEGLEGQTVVVTFKGNAEKLYFIVEENGGVIYHYGDEAAAKLALETRLTGEDNKTSVGTSGYRIILYHNMTSENKKDAFPVYGTQGKSYGYDLNGFVWTIKNPAAARNALTFGDGNFFIYSTAPNGKLVIDGAKSFLLTDTGGTVYIGERTSSVTTPVYGMNLTVECAMLNDQGFYGNSLYINGGTFIQPDSASVEYFSLLNNSSMRALKYATFIIKDADYIFKVSGVSIDGTILDCVFISEKEIPLFGYSVSESFTKAFQNCYFYNVKPCEKAGRAFTFTNCYFNYSSLEVQKNGYIAYTGEQIVKNVNGADYTFTASCLAAENVGLVNWGFGLQEYWATGATAEHAETIVDSFFRYAFTPVEITEAGEYEAEYRMTAMRSGVLGMGLSLQSSIGVILQVNGALKGVTAVQIGDEVFVIDASESGKTIKRTAFIAPKSAADALRIVITVGENEHEISTSIGTYAKTILSSNADAYVKAHKLTYAMAKYVEAMTKTDILDGMESPDGYEPMVLEAAAAKNPSGLLKYLAFELENTIAIAVAGDIEDPEAIAALQNREVNVVLATGRSERAVINEAGYVIFEDLYVNEFFGEMTIKLAGEEGVAYTFSLANYLSAMQTEEQKTVIQALYNYTYYADAYVKALSAN